MTQQVHALHGSSTKRTDGIKAPYFDGSQPCAQTDPELFFPERGLDAIKSKKMVKVICGSCDFTTECLEYSLTTDVLGTWGGLLEKERRALKRMRRKAS
jgi:hypothetical protein